MCAEKSSMGYKVTCHCRPEVNREHNIRDPNIVSSERHIDPSRPHETILDYGTLQQSYELIFGDAVNNYNAKQKRKDRKINNYLDKILSDNRKGKHLNIRADGRRKPAYEMILQLGNRDNQPNNDVAIDILKGFCHGIRFKYRNIQPIGIYLHNDEFSVNEETGERIFSPPHIHYDFIYVAHLGKSLKTGMDLQSSMSGALEEMGFRTSKWKGTAQTQFEESVRHDLQDYAEERGLKIDRTIGWKHHHMNKDVYQIQRDTEKRSERLKEKERNIEIMKSSLAYKMVETKQMEYDLFQEREKLSKKEELLEEKRKLAITYTKIAEEVKQKNISLNTEIAYLENNSIPLTVRLSTFIKNIRKLIAKVITDLNEYKFAFQRFWTYGAKEFQSLALQMEQNNCQTYEEFNDKYKNGKLDYQQKEKQEIKGNTSKR